MNPHTDPEVMPATVDLLYERLKSMYWDAATREACNMIKFYNELMTSNYNPDEDIASLENETFRKMFNVWTGGQRGLFKSFDTSKLYSEAVGRATERFNISKPEHCARLVLQSSALLDIDVLYEPAPRLYPSHHRGAPNVEIVTRATTESEGHGEISNTALRGVYCSRCGFLIRSPLYYECRNGCPDRASADRPSAAIKANGKVKIGSSVSLLKHSNRRLCTQCFAVGLSHDDCNQDHFHRWHYQNPKNKGTAEFQKQLSEKENKKYFEDEYKSPSKKFLREVLRFTRGYKGGPQALQGIMGKLRLIHNTALIPILPSTNTHGLSQLKSTAKGIMTPAGHFHLALMFGPLIFESGVPNTRRGVLITPRPLPTLFSSTAVAEALVDEVQDDPQGLFADCAIFYQDKESKTRGFYREHRRVSSRSTLACLKRVYGGSFSGYPASANQKEASVIHCLTRVAPKCKYSSKRVSAQREQLHRSASELIVHIKELLGVEVEKYLRRIAKLLMDSRMKMSWNMWRNNCQRLVNRLLGGKDFEYVFPRLPPNFGSRTQDGDAEQFRWPRYLISFGGHIEGYGISLDQPNSVLTNFCQNKKVDYDIMEYLIGAHSRLSKSLAQLALIDSNTEAGHTAVLGANALWELPLDTLSLLQFHFTLPPHKYFDKSDESDESDKPLTHKQWIDNRLSLLRLLDIFASLTGGLGVALLSLFTRKPNLISKVTIPKSLVFGAARADDVIRTLRISPLTTIYLLSRRGGTEALSIFDDEAAKWKEELEMKLSMLLQKFSQQRALKACIAFATIYVHRVNKARKGLTGVPLLPLLLLPQTIDNSIKSWKQYEGGWFTFEVGDIMCAQQILGKTKNIRK